MLKTLLLLLAAAVMFSNYGCATMIRGTEQELSITSEPDGATAKLSNGQTCVTPCQVKLKRNKSIMVKYEKDGCEPQTMSVFPTLAGGGVILGGVIDYGTGAVYNLVPNPCHVLLKCAQASARPEPMANPPAPPTTQNAH